MYEDLVHESRSTVLSPTSVNPSRSECRDPSVRGRGIRRLIDRTSHHESARTGVEVAEVHRVVPSQWEWEVKGLRRRQSDVGDTQGPPGTRLQSGKRRGDVSRPWKVEDGCLDITWTVRGQRVGVGDV